MMHKQFSSALQLTLNFSKQASFTADVISSSLLLPRFTSVCSKKMFILKISVLFV